MLFIAGWLEHLSGGLQLPYDVLGVSQIVGGIMFCISFSCYNKVKHRHAKPLSSTLNGALENLPQKSERNGDFKDAGSQKNNRE